MLSCESIAPGIKIIRARIGPRHANTYIIGRVVVEPCILDHTEGADWIELARELDIDQALVTHRHYDHTRGVAALSHALGWHLLQPEDLVDEIDGWRVLRTPGHAPEHICLYRDGVLIAGDMVSDEGATVFDAPAYSKSLSTLIALSPRLVLPAHGNILTSLP